MKKTFANRLQLCYSDTDSFVICLHTLNLNNDLKKISNTLDTSNFNKQHPLYSPEHASELFYFKMELPSHNILAAVFLKAKAYAFLIEANNDQYIYENKNKQCSDYTVRKDKYLQLHRCKGIPAVARKNLLFEHYLNILLENKIEHKVIFNKLSSKSHTIHQVKQKKLALTSFDDKRQLLNCSIHTKPYGYANLDPQFKCLVCNLD